MATAPVPVIVIFEVRELIAPVIVSRPVVSLLVIVSASLN